ncbi:hypothetical protein [Runella salmonicolor]|uniref:Interferon-induced transmembrane protein n=1 Tax=Runella salmonicolor TaxID=2950278 RepID=A0ABT1FUY5_9BACT|nr:hypothetical protein [Runella salmonicolor]MCP1385569.1 hypothetical protein [Runella salmonicolor]
MNERLLDYRFYGTGAFLSFVALIVLPLIFGSLYYYYVHGSFEGLDTNKPIDERSKTLIIRIVLVVMCVLFYFLSIMLFAFLIETFLKAQQGINNQNHPTAAFIAENKHRIIGLIQKIILVISIIGIVLFQRLYR